MPPAPAARQAWTIDVLRVVAAGTVAVFHLSWRGALLPGLYPIGWLGVQVFFVISGAVILGSAHGRTVRPFLFGRVRRLYPAGLACCALNLAVIAVFRPWFAIPAVYADASPARVLGSVVLAGERFLSTAYWTLPVELSFYLCIAAALGLGRLPWRAVSMALVLLSVPWHVHALLPPLLAAGLAQFLPVSLTDGVLARYSMYFGLGMMLWLAARRPVGAAGWATVTLAAGLAVREMALRIATDIAPNYRGTADLHAMLPVAAALWGVACIAVWAGLADRCAALPPRAARILHAAALATYPFYLLHETVAGGVMGALVAHGAAPVPALLAGLGTCACASHGVVALWERPACRLLDRAAAYRPWRLRAATVIAKADSSLSSDPLATNSTSSATPAFPTFSIRSSTP